MFDGFLGTVGVLYQLTLGTLDPVCQGLLGALLTHLGFRGALKVPGDLWRAPGRILHAAGFAWDRFAAWRRRPSQASRLERVEMILDCLERKV